MEPRKIDDELNQWLRDAYAMEGQAVTMLEGEVGRLKNYPELRERMKLHAEETRSQQARLEAVLERRGTTPSSVKNLTAKLTATVQDLSGVFAGDEAAKGAMAGYAFEHYEISAYKMLIAGAEEAGDRETARVCEDILREEEAMAEWMAAELPRIARIHLQRAAAGMAEAKR